MDLRLFIAIELPEEWKAALAALQQQLRSALPGLRWARADGLHLTLKFLGNVDSARVPAITAALTAAADSAAPFTLRPGSLGTFGGSRPRVIWAGVEGDSAALAALWRAVDAAMTAQGFSPERGPFAAHLTLARVPDDRRVATGGLLATLRPKPVLPPLPPLTVTGIALTRSELGAGGSRYTQLAWGNLRSGPTNAGKDPHPMGDGPVI